MSRLVGRKLQGTLGAHAASGLEAVPRYARRQKSLLGQGGGFWNYRWRSITSIGDVRDSDYRCGVLFFKLSWIIVAESADRWAGRAGNFQSKVLFEKKESEKLGETTGLQNRLHPSQQKIFSIFSVRTALHRRQFPPLFIRPSLDMQLLGIQ